MRPSTAPNAHVPCLLCRNRADHWHHVLTSNAQIMLNVSLCTNCHTQIHRLNPKFTDKFLKSLKRAVGKLSLAAANI